MSERLELNRLDWIRAEHAETIQRSAAKGIATSRFREDIGYLLHVIGLLEQQVEAQIHRQTRPRQPTRTPPRLDPHRRRTSPRPLALPNLPRRRNLGRRRQHPNPRDHQMSTQYSFACAFYAHHLCPGPNHCGCNCHQRTSQ